jgi:hypothetical protein
LSAGSRSGSRKTCGREGRRSVLTIRHAPIKLGNCYETTIEGSIFLVCTEPIRDERTGELSGRWHAWSFFAYDRSASIFPAGTLPPDVPVQESIAGGVGDTEDEARCAVENSLRRVIQTKNLDGTGFYSPPGNFIYPQGLPRSN